MQTLFVFVGINAFRVARGQERSNWPSQARPRFDQTAVTLRCRQRVTLKITPTRIR